MSTHLNRPTIPEFYDGKTIFVTGATGFVGKVLIEKLLRSCPGIKTIYVLLRPKQGMSASARVDSIFSSQLFDYLKEHKPSSVGKVVPIPGDVSQPNLALSSSHRELLVNHVELVFHCAATIKFNEPLKEAVEINLLGTKRLLELCKEMKKLMAVVHISTAYVNCTRRDSVVEEVIYPSPAPVMKFIDTVEWMDEDILNRISPHILKDWPNTYTYTKALAECLVAEESEDIPFAIVRPSIITSAWKEPLPGWVDNCAGLTGAAIAVSKGVLRSMMGKNCLANIIPVDVVTNLTISAGWYTALNRNNHALKVFHCTSSTENSITWNDIANYTVTGSRQNPLPGMYRYPAFAFTTSRFQHRMSLLFHHWIPGIFTDLICLILGKKPRMHKIYGKLHHSSRLLEYFTIHGWNFTTKNMQTLLEELSDEDRKNFDFDVKSLNWSAYWEDYILGFRQYVLKGESETLAQSRIQSNRLLRLQRTIQYGALLIGVAVLIRKIRPLRRLSTFLVFYVLKLMLKLMLLVAA